MNDYEELPKAETILLDLAAKLRAGHKPPIAWEQRKNRKNKGKPGSWPYLGLLDIRAGNALENHKAWRLLRAVTDRDVYRWCQNHPTPEELAVALERVAGEADQ